MEESKNLLETQNNLQLDIMLEFIVYLLVLLLAAGPVLIAFYFVSKTEAPSLLQATLLGTFGWIIAQVLLFIPRLLVGELVLRQAGFDTAELSSNSEKAAQASEYLANHMGYILMLALLFGITAQFIRFYEIMKFSSLSKTPPIIAFGLGWGFTETAFLYTPQLTIALLDPGQSLTLDPSLLSGALERSLYAFLTVLLSILVWSSVTQGNLKPLLQAINWHVAYLFIPQVVGWSLRTVVGDVGRIIVIDSMYFLVLIAMIFSHQSLFQESLEPITKRIDS